MMKAMTRVVRSAYGDPRRRAGRDSDGLVLLRDLHRLGRPQAGPAAGASASSRRPAAAARRAVRPAAGGGAAAGSVGMAPAGSAGIGTSGFGAPPVGSVIVNLPLRCSCAGLAEA